MPEKKKRKVFGFTKYRRAWMQAHRLEAVIYMALPPFEVDGDEQFISTDTHFGADNVILHIGRGRNGVFIDLTSLTEEELTCLRDIIVLAIDTAMPVTQYIDKAAVVANEAGEAFSPRPFRVRPVFHIKDMTINIPDNYKENHEQDGGNRPPPVEPFFTRPE